MSACGNPKCSSSTGIHEGMTFGSGRLDRNGYWEFPCRICAEAFDKERPEHIKRIRQEFIERQILNWFVMGDAPASANNYIKQQEWPHKAWPFANQDITLLTKEIQDDLREQEGRWAEIDREYDDS